METEKQCDNCSGKGWEEVYTRCNQMPSNCCGGCTTQVECTDCEGRGVVYTDEDE